MVAHDEAIDDPETAVTKEDNQKQKHQSQEDQSQSSFGAIIVAAIWIAVGLVEGSLKLIVILVPKKVPETLEGNVSRSGHDNEFVLDSF